MNDLQKQSDKLTAIQHYLASGMNRSEVALKLGYSGWRSLDIYMRRSGMRWNGTFNKYISEDELSSSDAMNFATAKEAPSRIAKIIALFNDIDPDPRQIAKQAGFNGHLEMAQYMSEHGFLWSAEVGNYVRKTSSTQYIDEKDIVEKPDMDASADNSRSFSNDDMGRYARLMELLITHEDRLMELLVPESHSRTIPRYFVPGITRTKSFYMSDSLSKLLNEFCRHKNLSQKEVIEAALVEFLSKYSFKNEVDKLIFQSI